MPARQTGEPLSRRGVVRASSSVVSRLSTLQYFWNSPVIPGKADTFQTIWCTSELFSFQRLISEYFGRVDEAFCVEPSIGRANVRNARVVCLSCAVTLTTNH